MTNYRSYTREVNGVRFTSTRDADISHYGYGGEPVYYAPAVPRTDKITFARLEDDTWGLKGVGLVSGATVTVTKKGGDTVERVVGEVETKDGYDYATIAVAPQVQRVVTAEVTVPASQTAVVPDGRYAVYNDNQSVNDIAFYKVDNVIEGNWAGFTFVKQIVGPDEQKVGQKQGRAILAKIAAMGVVESFQLYGRTIEKCGVCNRRLTNKESREYGIGPDCRAKYGY